MVEGGDHTGSTPLFAIFIFSFFSLYIIPYTLYRLFGSIEDEERVRISRAAGGGPGGAL